MHSSILVIPCILYITYVNTQEVAPSFKLLKNLYDQCSGENEVFKCLKIQALKVADRALHSKSFTIMEGITVVGDDRVGRSFNRGSYLNDTKLKMLKEDQVDDLLSATASMFLDTHRIQVSVPKLVEESRKKKNKGNYGALLWALAIKGSFLAMAYKGIAVMAGTALIVGKMALLLSAILGLKKLVSHGHEKTTFEIVKHPKYSESHSHSSSYEDEHYRRAWDPSEVQNRQEKVFRAFVKK